MVIMVKVWLVAGVWAMNLKCKLNENGDNDLGRVIYDPRKFYENGIVVRNFKSCSNFGLADTSHPITL